MASTHDELVRYLAADVEHTHDVLAWWHEHRTTYPRLSRMAFDYLSIPGSFLSESCYGFTDMYLIPSITVATSVDVERTFSRGRLLLSHVCSRLNVQSIRALLCLGAWSLMGLVKDKDVLDVTRMADLKAQEEDSELEVVAVNLNVAV